MKKVILIAIINVMAFVAILALIRNEFGNTFSIKLFVPAVIIFSTNLAATLMSISQK